MMTELRLQCHATTKAGTRCKLPAEEGSEFCTRHRASLVMKPVPEQTVLPSQVRRVRYCMMCGRELKGASFCGSCGTAAGSTLPLRGESQTSAPASVSKSPRGNAELRATDDTGRGVGVLCAIAAGGIAVGSFLPWVSITAPFVGTVTKSGIEDGGDGWFTLAAAVVIGLMSASVAAHGGRSGAKALIILLAVGVGLLAIVEYVDISDRFSEARAELDSGDDVLGVGSDLVALRYGVGLHLISASAVVAFLGGIAIPTWRYT